MGSSRYLVLIVELDPRVVDRDDGARRALRAIGAHSGTSAVNTTKHNGTATVTEPCNVSGAETRTLGVRTRDPIGDEIELTSE